MRCLKYNLSYYWFYIVKMGELFLIVCVFVLLGDMFQYLMLMLVWVVFFNMLVMYLVNCWIYYWFVFNCIVWDGWEDFIIGGWIGISLFINLIDMFKDLKLVFIYFGVLYELMNNYQIMLFVFCVFNLIYNEWYRDEDLIDKCDWYDDILLCIVWEKDYFISFCLWIQKGLDVIVFFGELVFVWINFQILNFCDVNGNNIGMFEIDNFFGDD